MNMLLKREKKNKEVLSTAGVGCKLVETIYKQQLHYWNILDT